MPPTKLSAPSRRTLRAFAEGRLNPDQLGEWLAVTDYDDSLSQAERDELARLRQVLTSVREGLQPESALRAEVQKVLRASPPQPPSKPKRPPPPPPSAGRRIIFPPDP